jgi:hypothetical protein
VNSKILHKYLEIKDMQESQHNSTIFQYLWNVTYLCHIILWSKSVLVKGSCAVISEKQNCVLGSKLEQIQLIAFSFLVFQYLLTHFCYIGFDSVGKLEKWKRPHFCHCALHLPTTQLNYFYPSMYYCFI